MRAAAAKGFINATDCADYLVGKGLPFRDAYKATGELVAQCIDRGLTLETLPLEELPGQFAICLTKMSTTRSIWTPAWPPVFPRAVPARKVWSSRSASTGVSRQLSIIKYWHSLLDYAKV